MWPALVLSALVNGPARAEDAARPPIENCAAWSARALERRLDRRTDSRELSGNAALLLVDGAAAWARRLELTADADLVLVKTFLWNDDEVGRATARLLAERARAGATVVVQYDFKANLPAGAVLGALLSDGDAPPTPEVLRPLVEAGALVLPTNVPNRGRERRRTEQGAAREAPSTADAAAADRGPLTSFDHEKYWITGHLDGDGLRLTAITGGLNVGSEYAYGGTPQVDGGTGRGGWRDTDVELRGPVVEALTQRFFAVAELNAAGGLPVGLAERWTLPQAEAGPAAVRFVWAQPRIGRSAHVERLYRVLTRATPEDGTITLETAYFAPTPATFRSLRGALEEGVQLRVLTNSRGSTDVSVVAAASLAAFEGLLRASPEAFFGRWQAAPGAETLHSKVASFGACGPAVVGSANLDGLSAKHNSESVVLIRDPSFRADFDAMIAADLGRAVPYTLDDAAERAWLARAWSGFLYRAGWYWL